MGSGETTPTMVKLHRQIFERLGPGARPVLLGTPYGFQTNASDISARAVSYFKQSVGQVVEVVPMPRTENAPARQVEEAMAQVAGAQWVFSGPGSPTYALRQWRGSAVPHLLEDKLALGGAVVFASAAALTLGRWTVPVYEIYKCGAEVAWADGLDLLGALGLDVAVIAHYDNAEGGNHDTRYCYLGEERLRRLEDQLDGGTWVLGVDEHTAAVFDLEAATMTVAGLGTVTVRAAHRSRQLDVGTTVSIGDLVSTARSLTSGRSQPRGDGAARAAEATAEPASVTGTDAARGGPPAAADGGGGGAGLPAGHDDPLLVEVRRLSGLFDAALVDRDAGAAMEAVFSLEEALRAWSADTFQSDHVDRATAALRRMLARLGELATVGLREPRTVAAPWVDALMAERSEARRAKRFADGDRIRDTLVDLGVEVRDTPGGSTWDLR
jgi:hypothetical protein